MTVISGRTDKVIVTLGAGATDVTADAKTNKMYVTGGKQGVRDRCLPTTWRTLKLIFRAFELVKAVLPAESNRRPAAAVAR